MKPIVYNIAKAERQIAELKQSIEELKIGEMGYQARIEELKAENEKLKEENVDLRFETVRAFERGKCRAWQNGYNATCERECDNCEVIADMQNLKNVLSKLLFDYADDLRGDAE